MCVLSSLRQVISLLHHPLCQTETYIYCTVDMLQPYSWREEKKNRGRRAEMDWGNSASENALILMLSPNQKARKIFRITFEILGRKSELKLYEATQRCTDSSGQASHSSAENFISLGHHSLEDCAFTWEFHDEPLGTKAVLNTQWNI